MVSSQVSNNKWRYAVAGRCIDDYKRIMMLVSQNNIAGLNRLVATACQHGASAHSIGNLMECTIAGHYCP